MIRLSAVLIACLMSMSVSAQTNVGQAPGAQTPSWDDPAWYAAPPAPLDLSMTVDAARAVSAVIGPAGGSFAAQGANGDTYTLSIPEGALFTDTTIAIWPVATVAGMPEGAGPFSGVILEPEGLQLARTGWLEITPAVPIPAANRALWGFYAAGADARGEINWPGVGDRIVIPLDHFSGAGVSIADRINLQLDRWRQTALEDRVRSQLAEMIRQSAAGGTWDGQAFADAFGRDAARVLQHGWRMIASRPAATCDDLKGVAASVLALERQGQLLGVAAEESVKADLAGLFDRYWSVCFPEEVQVCLRTGDLRVLVEFALSFERQRQLLGMGEEVTDPTAGQRQADLRAALERCGRFTLQVAAQGQYRDPSGIHGQVSFRVDVPMRLTFTDPNSFNYLIEGEAPASGVNVTFFDDQCWRFEGFVNARPMLARVTTYEFRHDDSHAPLRLELRATAPEILADLSCQGDRMSHRIMASMSPMLWAVAHQRDRNGEVLRLARFQARAHPVLWEMDWVDQGTDDGIQASDQTRLTFIHIAQ